MSRRRYGDEPKFFDTLEPATGQVSCCKLFGAGCMYSASLILIITSQGSPHRSRSLPPRRRGDLCQNNDAQLPSLS